VILDVKAGDEVICQSMTFAASANPITYLGAEPVFVDSEPQTWNMDPKLLKKAIEDRIKKTGKKPKAIIPVHLYGMPAQIQQIMDVAEEYKIPVIEDAAESLGSHINGKKWCFFVYYKCSWIIFLFSYNNLNLIFFGMLTSLNLIRKLQSG
jgi:dTDP-4-amino-4,6-dideoxygalactose transaminase